MYNKNEIYDFIFLGEKDYKASKRDRKLVALLVLIVLLGLVFIKD